MICSEDQIGNLYYGIYIWHLPIFTEITPIITSKVPLEAFYMKFIYVFSCQIYWR
jgi:hypothetical protein